MSRLLAYKHVRVFVSLVFIAGCHDFHFSEFYDTRPAKGYFYGAIPEFAERVRIDSWVDDSASMMRYEVRSEDLKRFKDFLQSFKPAMESDPEVNSLSRTGGIWLPPWAWVPDWWPRKYLGNALLKGLSEHPNDYHYKAATNWGGGADALLIVEHHRSGLVVYASGKVNFNFPRPTPVVVPRSSK